MLQMTQAAITLPLTDPVLKFLLILVIILAAPLLLNKLRIPHLLGLIIAGAIIGPNGFNLVLRDSSIILSGTAGLLYIMFLAGLEIDLGDFKKNKWKITDEDWRNREKWDTYEKYVDRMITLTSTDIAPWTILEGNDKKYARIKALKTIVKRLEKRLEKEDK